MWYNRSSLSSILRDIKMIKLKFDIKFMGKINPKKIIVFLRIHNCFSK